MAEPLTIIETDGPVVGTRILTLSGPCTLSELFEFKSILRARTAPVTLLDLTQVPYMDSAALGLIIGLHVACEAEHRKYALIGVCPRIKTLFQVAKVDSFLITVDTVDAALAGV